MKENKLNKFISRVENLKVLGIIVNQNQQEIASYFWEEDKRRLQYSGTKTFVSMAVGIAIGEGMFKIDDKVCDFFREELQGLEYDERLEKLTIHNLLTMSVGQDQAYLTGDARYLVEEKDWIKFALTRPFVANPGDYFMYNNVGPYLAGIIIQKCTNQSLVDYMMPRIFEPLGIERPNWEMDPLGNTFGGAGLEISITELMRFGQLIANGGSWNGKQLIPEDWIKKATSKLIETKGVAENLEDNQYGYGYQMWQGRYNTFRSDGMYGQYCIVVPEKNAVIAINAYEMNRQAILDAVWETVLPILD